jgi:hypothetical protein
MKLTYEEAKAAHEQGEKVECRILQFDTINWGPLGELATHPENVIGEFFEFRIDEPDPYAELKAAEKAGKVIQWLNFDAVWVDCDWCKNEPTWMLSPDRYRVKPDELKIEAGLTFAQFQKSGRRGRRKAWGLPCVGYSWANWHQPLKKEDIDATDWEIEPKTPAPYDNWQHVPAWANWQAWSELYKHWRWYANEPEKSESMYHCRAGLVSSDQWGAIPEGYCPTNFTGTWDQSLQERPAK